MRSYFCVTTNLSKGEPAAHCRGKLWRLVRASMTIVGLVPPVFYQGDLLIDGGYLNNMPVDVMHAMGAATAADEQMCVSGGWLFDDVDSG